MNDKKQIIIPLILLIVIGTSLTSNSELANTRNIDIVQLVVFGILLGVFIANLKRVFWNKK